MVIMHAEMERINALSSFEVIEEFMLLEYIKGSMICLVCKQEMHLKITKDGVDGYNWRCMNYVCLKYQSTKSLRSGSWLANYKMSGKDILKFLLLWSFKFDINSICNLTGLSQSTVKRLRTFILEKIKNFYDTNPVKLGGPGINVQIDETMVNYKAKSHRGRSPREQIWALVIVDVSRTPSKCFVKIVENRTASTLLPIISSVVRSGSIISTDEFLAYSRLAQMNDYEHKTVCHKYHFIDPQTNTHTQHVESCNNSLKYAIKKAKGVKKVFFDLFIAEFMFFNHFSFQTNEKIQSILRIKFD